MNISVLQATSREEYNLAKSKYNSSSQCYKSLKNKDSAYGKEIYRLSILHFKVMQIWHQEIDQLNKVE